ncbi:glycerophosphodiester phosphodiesterase family protein [Morganella morganii]|uniref:glycerophosphodiester phosphodiesterase family protein n=1 Tax=Morganella morganii TaxID=582 RepID=UPI0032DB3DA4
MIIAAHRGFAARAPENTMAAFRQAAEFGCLWIETDVQLSADGVPVLIHDETVNRTTNGSGKVTDLTLRELRALDAGLWAGEAYRGEKIPLLTDLLALAEGSGLHLNLELKTELTDSDHAIAQLCEATAAVLEMQNFPAERILFSGFDTRTLRYMHKRMPHIRRGQLWEKIPPQPLTLLQEIEAFSVHCDWLFLREDTAKSLRKAGYQVFCYTPNYPELVAHFADWGVGMLITDNPAIYRDENRFS